MERTVRTISSKPCSDSCRAPLRYWARRLCGIYTRRATAEPTSSGCAMKKTYSRLCVIGEKNPS